MHLRRAGLTLIELLIIIVIIGLVAAVAIQHIRERHVRAQRGAFRTDIRNAVHAEDLYFQQHQSYATLEQLEQANLFHPPAGDSMVILVTPTGYTATNMAPGAKASDSTVGCHTTVKSGGTVDSLVCQ